MLKDDYLFYSDYFKDRNIDGKKILVAKLKKSYLIGPLINNRFREDSFYRRLLSNSIYDIKEYKKIINKTCLKLINKYVDSIKSNEVLEIKDDGTMELHKIIKVPGDNNE